MRSQVLVVEYCIWFFGELAHHRDTEGAEYDCFSLAGRRRPGKRSHQATPEETVDNVCNNDRIDETSEAFVPKGHAGFGQSSSPDWSKKEKPLCSLCLCGEYIFFNCSQTNAKRCQEMLNFFKCLAGTPATMVKGGTSLSTKDAAPTTDPCPMVVFGITMAPVPNQASSSMVIGP